MTKVLIVGTGGVGTVVAYSIDYNKKAEVSIVVRRDYEKVISSGYQIESVDHGKVSNWKPAHVYPNVETAAKQDSFDFVVVATKNLPDITKVEDVIEPLIKSDKTSIVLMQNGFNIGEPIIAKYPNNVCLSGVTFVGSHNYNGLLKQTQHEVTQISYFPNKNLSAELQESVAKKFVEIYSTDRNTVTYSPDSKYARYRKLIYNGTLNPICTLVNTDTGRVELAGGNEKIVIPCMREIMAVAKADGVDLPESCINEMLHDDDGDWFSPSMCVDARKGNPLELEVILGNLLQVARRLHVATPTLDVVYNLLTIVQFKLKEQSGLIKLPEERPISDKVWK